MGKTDKAKKVKFDGGRVGSFLLMGVLLLASLLLYSPSTGFFRTIPFVAVAGAGVYLFKMPVKYTGVFSFVLTFCVYIFAGINIPAALFFALVCAVMFYLGAFVCRLVVLFTKTANPTVKGKSIVLAVVSFVVLLLVSFFANGDVFSFVKNDTENTDYIADCYGDDVQKKYTLYHPLEMEYRTYVTFKDGKYLFGDDFDCHIGKKDGAMYDGVKEHYIEKLLSQLEGELSKITGGAKSGFFVVDSKIMTGTDKFSFEEGVEPIRSDVGYVLCYDGLLQENEGELFGTYCMSTLQNITDAGFDYERIVFCAGNGKQILYSTTAEKLVSPADILPGSHAFDKNDVEAFGITEEDILKYWQN